MLVFFDGASVHAVGLYRGTGTESILVLPDQFLPFFFIWFYTSNGSYGFLNIKLPYCPHQNIQRRFTSIRIYANQLPIMFFPKSLSLLSKLSKSNVPSQGNMIFFPYLTCPHNEKHLVISPFPFAPFFRAANPLLYGSSFDIRRSYKL